MKRSAINTKHFKTFCRDLGTESKTLLFHTEEQWLTKGNMLASLFELCDEEILSKTKVANCEFKSHGVQVVLTYLSDIFNSLNSLNLKLQRGDSNIIYRGDAIKTFIVKLELSDRKVLAQPLNYLCFPKLYSFSEETSFMNVFQEVQPKKKISNLLRCLTDEYSLKMTLIDWRRIYSLLTKLICQKHIKRKPLTIKLVLRPNTIL